MFGIGSDYETDAYENHERDEFDTDFGSSQSYTPKIVTCKHCKKSGFTWVTVAGKWKMKDRNGDIHQCLIDNAKKPKTEKQEATKAKLESVLGIQPSITDINYMLQQAAMDDKRDNYSHQ